MDKQYFMLLLKRYLKGQASSQEQEFLLTYYELFRHEADFVSLLEEEEREKLREDIETSIWNNINNTEVSTANIIRIRRLIRVVSAATLVVMSVTVISLLLNNSGVPSTTSLITHKQQENYFFRLPDGSTVIVDSGSKLTYPPSFDQLEKREVYLEGQAFFDIKHDPSKPFIVHTGHITTTVLGTSFIIKALPSSKTISVIVTRGKVKVADKNKTLAVLKKDEQVVFNKESSTTLQQEVQAESLQDWKAEDLLFNDVTVGEAATLLEKKFGVSIQFKDREVQHERFTTMFTKDENLEQMLKSICGFNGAEYKYYKEKGIVIINKK
jgi:ferric-dicitrate binding protein FerR (iron transport regulator)